MSVDWMDIEVELIVADYLSMLSDELNGIPFNKSSHRKNLAKLLLNRSDGSIEFKHQNISAAMIKLGLPYIKGYKPRWNFQEKLIDHITQQIFVQKNNFIHLFENFVQASTSIFPEKFEFSNLLDSPPERTEIKEPEVSYEKRPIKINYLEKEQQNSDLGKRGEEFVLEYEKWRLIQEGKETLSEKIEWIAKEDDGAGFDILSKNSNGTDRYIEVKTTKLAKETPIFFSKNEYDFSLKNKNSFYMYRLFNFNKSPKMFQLNGDFDSFCLKEAIQFRGYI